MLESFWKRQSSRNSSGSVISGGEELELALNVADILDELNMLLLLIETQSRVITSMHRGMYRFRPIEAKNQNMGCNITMEHTTTGNIRISNVTGSFLFRDADLGSVEISRDDSSAPGLEAIAGQVGVFIHETEEGLKLERSNVERLHLEATQTHKMVGTSKLTTPKLHDLTHKFLDT